MVQTTTFDSSPVNLRDILNSIRTGRIQLPDFQRGWVWEDERIRKLLVSIAMSYPIGAIMMLQTGNPGVRFVPKPIEGVMGPLEQPEKLILDGQQRLTSIFQSMVLHDAVKTKDDRGREIRRYYYIDINKILDPLVDREDVIISVPENKIVLGKGNRILADYSNVGKECNCEVLPLSILFDAQKMLDWQNVYFSDPSRINERASKWTGLMRDVFPRFQGYLLPVITLLKDTPKGAICQVFEYVNTGGVPLNVFELLTAQFAAEDYRLGEEWRKTEAKFKNSGDVYNKILAQVGTTEFLQTVSLLATYEKKKANPDVGVSCKRDTILNLTLDEFKRLAPKATEGIIEAAKFLQEQYIFSATDLPYGTQIVPLAAIFVELGRAKANDLSAREALARWFWCGVLGELYGSATESRFAKDLPEIIEWITKNAPEPSTIAEATFSEGRFLTLRTKNSAAYKGLHALMMKSGCKDFYSGIPADIQNYYADQIDIHHIFPRKYCDTMNIPYDKRDSIINKAPLSYLSNRSIGGDRPSEYLKRIEKDRNTQPATLDGILASHLLEPQHLRGDDFDAFYEDRKNRIVNIIEKAMGKEVTL